MASIAVARPQAASAGPACADDPEVMFPLSESQRPGARTEGERRALAVCAGCPVLAACRQAVLDTLDSAPMPYGVAGGLTREDRRAIRAHRRDLVADPARPAAQLAGRLAVAAIETATRRPAEATQHQADEAGTEASTEPDPGLVVVDALDEQVHTAIAAHSQVAKAVDPATVRALAAGDGPEWASRWEVALAAVVLLARGRSVTAAARALGEEYVQVKRWGDRANAGHVLVVTGGTEQLRRPDRLVGRAVGLTVDRGGRVRGAA